MMNFGLFRQMFTESFFGDQNVLSYITISVGSWMPVTNDHQVSVARTYSCSHSGFTFSFTACMRLYHVSISSLLNSTKVTSYTGW